MHSMHNAVAILTSHVSTMTVVVSTLSSIWCLPISLYKTTMPIGLDRLPLSMCKRCATVQRVRRLAMSVAVAYASLPCLPLELLDDRRLGRMRHQRVANLGPMTKTGQLQLSIWTAAPSCVWSPHRTIGLMGRSETWRAGMCLWRAGREELSR